MTSNQHKSDLERKNVPLHAARRIQKIQKNPNTRHHPTWDYYEWVMHKSRYMKQCTKQGIPMIDTIHVENGFKARDVLKKIVAKGWEKFFVKPAYMSFFGAGVINGTSVRRDKELMNVY